MKKSKPFDHIYRCHSGRAHPSFQTASPEFHCNTDTRHRCGAAAPCESRRCAIPVDMEHSIQLQPQCRACRDAGETNTVIKMLARAQGAKCARHTQNSTWVDRWHSGHRGGSTALRSPTAFLGHALYAALAAYSRGDAALRRECAWLWSVAQLDFELSGMVPAGNHGG